MEVVEPRTLLLLLSRSVTLTQTWAGECRVGRETASAGRSEGPAWQGRRTRGAAPGGGSGGSQPLLAPRLPLLEVFSHRRVPAQPPGAPLHLRRLRGPHAVRAVRQLRGDSQDGAAGAVDGAGGAGVLGGADTDPQGQGTDSPSEREDPAPLLQPERGRRCMAATWGPTGASSWGMTSTPTTARITSP
uniref:Uncharacterized protein n=1 Tax=Callithrix jacchus TaxID=9483 RepID=A0A2R8MFK7_CALJA